MPAFTFDHLSFGNSADSFASKCPKNPVPVRIPMRNPKVNLKWYGLHADDDLKRDLSPSYECLSPIVDHKDDFMVRYGNTSSFWGTDHDSIWEPAVPDEPGWCPSPFFVEAYLGSVRDRSLDSEKIVEILSKYDKICRQYTYCCQIDRHKRNEIYKDVKNLEDLDVARSRVCMVELDTSQRRSTLQSEMNALMAKLAGCYYPITTSRYFDAKIRLERIALENLEQISEEFNYINRSMSYKPSTIDSKVKLLSIPNSEGDTKTRSSPTIINQLLNSEGTTAPKKLGSRKLRSTSKPLISQPASFCSSYQNGHSSLSSKMKFMLSMFFIAFITSSVGGSCLSNGCGNGGTGFNGLGGGGGGYVPQSLNYPVDAKIYRLYWISFREGFNETFSLKLTPEPLYTRAQLEKKAQRLTHCYRNEYRRNGYEMERNGDGTIGVTIILIKLTERQPDDADTERRITTKNQPNQPSTMMEKQPDDADRERSITTGYQPSTTMGYMWSIAGSLVSRTSSIEADIFIETTKDVNGKIHRKSRYRPVIRFR